MELGKFTAQGFAQGIASQTDAVAMATRNLTAAADFSGSSGAGFRASAPANESSGGVRVWPGQTQAAPEPITIDSGGSKMDDLLVEILSKAVRTRGGVVQKVLGKTQVGVS
jgi:hypothetical protein